MKSKALVLLLAALVNCSTGTSHRVIATHGDEKSRDVISPVKQERLEVSRAALLVQKLESAVELERRQARRELGVLARESEESRAQVIRELTALVERSNAHLRLTSGVHYDAWSFAVEMLGDLKATESLDALVSCIECNDGTAGLSFDRYPVLKAVVALGPAAVPKLTEALSNERPATRKFAALALGEIGGDEAKTSLQNALPAEKDKEVETTIRP